MVAGSLWPFLVAVLAPVIRDELRLGAAELGVAYASYYLTASLSSYPAGRLVDAVPLRVSAAALCLSAGAQVLLLSRATNLTLLVCSGVVGGLSLGLANPVTNAAVAGHVHARHVRWAVGLKQAGVPLAAILAGWVLPRLVDAPGWRVAVAGAVAVPLVATVLAARLHARPDPVRSSSAPPRGTTRLVWYALLMGAVTAGLNGYLALYVVDGLGGSLPSAGAAVVGLAAAGAVGRVGWMGLAATRPTPMLLRALAVAGVLALLVLAGTSHPLVVGAAVVTLGLTVMSWLSLGMVAVVTGGSSRVGQGSGRILQAFYGGFVIGSPLVGHVIDQAGFRVVWVLLAGLAAVAALLCGPAPRLPSARG